ncbi:hypothetical protein GYMLUDRAFT_61817 [Collybiopsis luxurians FD-317 M1]|uniref:Nucleoplasmin-like domain-containing protein n=1 Tax=Collybiopsis luxurians FD-317 M1 TaxID=944289 RepID=A0A0D0BNZ5_9AGAR|nr:hypothetical protein GYMLUDRAFT_61817 [Collybiopsis luxurians FD-317 M1]
MTSNLTPIISFCVMDIDLGFTRMFFRAKNLPSKMALELNLQADLHITHIAISADFKDALARTSLTLTVLGANEASNMASQPFTIGNFMIGRLEHLLLNIKLDKGIRYLLKNTGPNPCSTLTIMGNYDTKTFRSDEKPTLSTSTTTLVSNSGGSSSSNNPTVVLSKENGAPQVNGPRKRGHSSDDPVHLSPHWAPTSSGGTVMGSSPAASRSASDSGVTPVTPSNLPSQTQSPAPDVPSEGGAVSHAPNAPVPPHSSFGNGPHNSSMTAQSGQGPPPSALFANTAFTFHGPNSHSRMAGVPSSGYIPPLENRLSAEKDLKKQKMREDVQVPAKKKKKEKKKEVGGSSSGIKAEGSTSTNEKGKGKDPREGPGLA